MSQAQGGLGFLDSLVSEAFEEGIVFTRLSLLLPPPTFLSFLFSPTDPTTCSSAKSKVSAKAVLKAFSRDRAALGPFCQGNWEDCQ